MSLLHDYIVLNSLPCTRLYDSTDGATVSAAGSSFTWNNIISPGTFDLTQSNPALKPEYIDSAVRTSPTTKLTTISGAFLNLSQSYTLLVAGAGEGTSMPVNILKSTAQVPLISILLGSNFEKAFSLEDLQTYVTHSNLSNYIVAGYSHDVLYGKSLSEGVREPDRGKPSSNYTLSLKVGEADFDTYFIAVFQPAISNSALNSLKLYVEELLIEIEVNNARVELDVSASQFYSLSSNMDIRFKYLLPTFINQDFSTAEPMALSMLLLFNLIWDSLTLENWDGMSIELWDTIL